MTSKYLSVLKLWCKLLNHFSLIFHSKYKAKPYVVKIIISFDFDFVWNIKENQIKKFHRNFSTDKYFDVNRTLRRFTKFLLPMIRSKIEMCHSSQNRIFFISILILYASNLLFYQTWKRRRIRAEEAADINLMHYLW